ncbi:transcriptional repressor [uncultured Polaribacter sp.]|uniref:Fur family transcriptional regulator n=1 Tax=uncultured Polaribacter sp. TaxID=174711 RepID=UPI00261D2322|nr:transcriptional repressor [uncultured Polaribacter sp.]
MRRNTPTKEAVLNVLTKSGKALSQDTIEERIDIDINRATIYRVLNRFCDDGVLHKIVAENGKQYFAICNDCEEEHNHDHFHFRCSTCETIECLPIEVNYSIPVGYSIEKTNCVLTGKCKDCSNNL